MPALEGPDHDLNIDLPPRWPQTSREIEDRLNNVDVYQVVRKLEEITDGRNEPEQNLTANNRWPEHLYVSEDEAEKMLDTLEAILQESAMQKRHLAEFRQLRPRAKKALIAQKFADSFNNESLSVLRTYFQPFKSGIQEDLKDALGDDESVSWDAKKIQEPRIDPIDDKYPTENALVEECAMILGIDIHQFETTKDAVMTFPRGSEAVEKYRDYKIRQLELSEAQASLQTAIKENSGLLHTSIELEDKRLAMYKAGLEFAHAMADLQRASAVIQAEEVKLISELPAIDFEGTKDTTTQTREEIAKTELDQATFRVGTIEQKIERVKQVIQGVKKDLKSSPQQMVYNQHNIQESAKAEQRIINRAWRFFDFFRKIQQLKDSVQCKVSTYEDSYGEDGDLYLNMQFPAPTTPVQIPASDKYTIKTDAQGNITIRILLAKV